jgi:hypothetical protein
MKEIEGFIARISPCIYYYANTLCRFHINKMERLRLPQVYSTTRYRDIISILAIAHAKIKYSYPLHSNRLHRPPKDCLASA